MLSEEDFFEIKKFKVKPGKAIQLQDYSTDYEGKTLTKSQSQSLLDAGIEHLA